MSIVGVYFSSQMVNEKQTKVNKEVLLMLGNHSLSFRNTYFFIKKVSSLFNHPIILDYNTKSIELAKQLKMPTSRFKNRIKKAISFGLISVEGNNIRLISINSELKSFGLTESKILKSKPSGLKELFKKTVALNYIRKQKQALFFKQREASRSVSVNTFSGSTLNEDTVNNLKSRKVNEDITISVVSYAKLIGCKSKASASLALRTLTETKVLKRTENLKEISKATFELIRSETGNSYNPNLKKQAGKYYYRSAFIYSIAKPPIVVNGVIRTTPITSDYRRDFSQPLSASCLFTDNLY